MRQTRWLLAMVITSSAPAAVFAEGATSVRTLAVLDFTSKVSARQGVDPVYLSERVRGFAIESLRDYRIITRENIGVILQASGKSADAACEASCAVETGRMLGADQIVTGDLRKFGSKFHVTMRLHESVSGALLATSQASGKNLDEVDAAHAAATAALLQSLRTPISANVQAPKREPSAVSPSGGTESVPRPETEMKGVAQRNAPRQPSTKLVSPSLSRIVTEPSDSGGSRRLTYVAGGAAAVAVGAAAYFGLTARAESNNFVVSAGDSAASAAKDRANAAATHATIAWVAAGTFLAIATTAFVMHW